MEPSTPGRQLPTISNKRHSGRGTTALYLAARWLLILALVIAGVRTTTAQNLPLLPDETVLSRLVWSTLLEVDSANRTGNYSVLHALGSPQFQQQNSVEDLALLFGRLRDNRVDVGKAILLEPTWHIPPAIDDAGVLRLRGGFEYRPKAIRFDLMYQNIQGGWRILAISIAEMNASER